MTKTVSAIGPVLAATDLADGGAEALRQAHALATHRAADLVVCHVLPEPRRVRMLFAQDAGPDRADQSDLQGRSRLAVRTQLEEATGRSGDQVTIVIATGSPHACLLDQAEQIGAGLIVVGAGSVALRVARYAPCPVLVARPSPTGGAVLGATDFSDPALPAVEAAVVEARRRAVPLTLIHCIDVLSPAMIAVPAMSPIPPLSEDVIREMDIAAQAHLAESLKQFDGIGECLVSHGPAAVDIVEVARSRGVAIVVVGTRGRTGLPRLALGSVAESVIAGAPCSVLAVHLSTGQSQHRHHDR